MACGIFKNMKIIVAMDSMKGSLSSIEAGTVICEVLAQLGEKDVQLFSLSDGGEGLLDALTPRKEQRCSCLVQGPLGEPLDVSWGVLPSGVCLIETATVCGLTLIPEEKRNPLNTTTYGLGLFLKEAIGQGYRDFLIGLGGSGTCDGGLGMLQALGLLALTHQGEVLPHCGRALQTLAKLDAAHFFPEKKLCHFRVACDVSNPLLGPNGAVTVFGPQKGLPLDEIPKLERGMAQFAALTTACMGNNFQKTPGAGAAGGLGFAFLSYLDGVLLSGAELVMEATGLDSALAEADLVITGEGKIDRQTIFGKGPGALGKAAAKAGIPVWAFGGKVTLAKEDWPEAGFCLCREITPAQMPLEKAMEPLWAKENLRKAVTEVDLAARNEHQ